MTYDEVYLDVKFGMLATDILCDFGDSWAPEKRPQHIDPATSIGYGLGIIKSLTKGVTKKSPIKGFTKLILKISLFFKC